jgi:hypothetical protein
VELLIEVADAKAEKTCPYMGPTPEGRASCTGLHCYARDECIRVLKTCRKWQKCSVYMMSKWRGIPFYKEVNE